MKLYADITRTAPIMETTTDVATNATALEEAVDYDFRFISPGFFLCIHGENAYAISEQLKRVGCACPDMTYKCKPPRDVCKHCRIFMDLPDYPMNPVDAGMIQLLEVAGWSGKFLHPPSGPKPARKKLPNIHDPARKPQPQAATRADQHKRYASMTPEQIIKETPQKKLEIYARRGAPLAIAEVQRRLAEQAVSA